MNLKEAFKVLKDVSNALYVYGTIVIALVETKEFLASK